MSVIDFPTPHHQGFSVFPIAAFNDNYIWCIQTDGSQRGWVIDPGDAAAVIECFQQRQLLLAGILITHHHRDHTGGISDLLQHYGDAVPVYGPLNPSIPEINHTLISETELRLKGVDGEVLHAGIFCVPGHTLDHIAYLIGNALFCGDALFSAGCGRLFEGTPLQLYQSLTKFARLPESTLVYPAHEYTLSNLKFARTVEPDNQAIVDYMREATHLRQQQLPTLPSSIKRELVINPFLHCTDERLTTILSQHSQQIADSAVTRLKLLRQWKDNF